MPKISVIVPVYNVEDYLCKCLDSIVNQTLSDIEIILVDDGSTDSSGHICDEYAIRDNRIRVIHKANGGLSSARNTGIDASSSSFVMFIDSDDWVEPGFCEQPYNAAINSNADLVLFTYRMIRDYDDTEYITKTGMQEGILNKSEALDFNVYYAQAAWLGLYRKQLFDSIRFPVGKLLEDVATTYKLVHAADVVYLLNARLYNYRVGRPGSIMTEPSSKKTQDLEEIWISEVNDLFEWGYRKHAVFIAITLLARWGCTGSEKQELIKIVRQTDRSTLSDFNWRKRTMFSVLKVSTRLFDKISAVSGRRENGV